MAKVIIVDWMETSYVMQPLYRIHKRHKRNIAMWEYDILIYHTTKKGKGWVGRLYDKRGR